jgi:hypothetical protein
MTATGPAPAAPTTPVADPAADLVKRIDRLERQVKLLRQKIRRMEQDEAAYYISPEMEAEIDRREAEVLSGNFVGIPWETVKAEALERLKQVRS